MFPKGIEWDAFAQKGVLYAKIIKNNIQPYHIFGTHTQAEHNDKTRQLRLDQIRQSRERTYTCNNAGI